MVDLQDRVAEEYRKTLKATEAKQELIQPTEAEARNGWTPESLTAYVAEQRAAQEIRVDPHSISRRMARRPTRTNSRKYRPLRWRG